MLAWLGRSHLYGPTKGWGNPQQRAWELAPVLNKRAGEVTLVCWGVKAQCLPQCCLDFTLGCMQVADMVELRSKSSLNYGVVLIPEGLVEFVPEMGVLISELNDLLVDDGVADQQKVAASLSPVSAKVSSELEHACVMEGVQAMQTACKLTQHCLPPL